MWILILLHAIFASTYSFGKLGLDYAQPIIQHFLTQIPVKFTVLKEHMEDCYQTLKRAKAMRIARVIEVDVQTGRAFNIERIRVIDEQSL